MTRLIHVPWADFESIYATFTPPISYLESASQYDIWQIVNGREFSVIIPKTSPAGADQTDFETNYKPTANIDKIYTQAQVTPASEMFVSQPPPSAPPNTTAVSRTVSGNISTSQDDLYTIPNGQTLTIQRFSTAAAEASTSTTGSLQIDENGNLSVLTLITLAVHNGASSDQGLSEEVVGNGTKRILMRREPGTGGVRLVFGRWQGFLKTT